MGLVVSGVAGGGSVDDRAGLRGGVRIGGGGWARLGMAFCAVGTALRAGVAGWGKPRPYDGSGLLDPRLFCVIFGEGESLFGWDYSGG